MNDTAETLTGELTIERWTYDGRLLSAETKTVTLPPDRATEVGVFSRTDAAKAEFLALNLKTPRGNADADYHFAPYRDLPLAWAKIGRKVENRGGRWTVTLTADTPAFFVWANARGMKGEFSDNSFTLLPGRSKVLVFDAKGNDVSLESFNANLSVVSLTDSFCGNQCSFLLK